MARMIPPTIPVSCPSPGEQEIFAKLKQEEATRDWIILHSLDIAQHLRQVSGETDFVIIVPSHGVLCLEVKACHSLERRDGLWFYGHDPKGDPRGPFKQAAEAMHSLRKQVIQNDTSLSRVPFWSAVAFPFIEFKAASGEWHPWQVIDSVRFKRQQMAPLVSGILRSARAHLGSQPSAKWFHDGDRLPDIQQSAAIARILRSNFEFTEKTHDRRTRKQAEILHYTEEQFAAIDMMEDNPRVLFTGPAGTGKTVLALETGADSRSLGRMSCSYASTTCSGGGCPKTPSRKAAKSRPELSTSTWQESLASKCQRTQTNLSGKPSCRKPLYPDYWTDTAMLGGLTS